MSRFSLTLSGSSVALVLFACLAAPGNTHAEAGDGGEPRVTAWSPEAAQRLRGRALSGDPQVAEAIEEVRAQADEALGQGPFSVTHKKFVPPSGDLHDFSTIGRYWWPNPDTEDGLPWVRRDGDTNPQYFDPDFGDTDRFVNLWRSVMALSRAYYVTDHEPYAEHAATLLRVWFVEPKTRMNPHARYAARFPGHWDGKSWGIHGTRHLADITDAVALLRGSDAWTTSDDEAIKAWMAEYLDWLLTSENGVEEQNTTNNHATAYDWLVVNLAYFVGQHDLARQVAEEAKTRRIAAQIEPDGSQPKELARANPWRYSGYSLEYFYRLAIAADRVGVDLWRYESPNGGSIRGALDYLVAHIQPKPGEIDEALLEEVGVSRIGPLLAIAADVYDDSSYAELMERIGWSNHLRINTSSPNPRLFVTE